MLWYAVRPHLSAPHISSSLTFCTNPTVHYTTAPSFIEFPHFLQNLIQNRCVRIGEVGITVQACVLCMASRIHVHFCEHLHGCIRRYVAFPLSVMWKIAPDLQCYGSSHICVVWFLVQCITSCPLTVHSIVCLFLWLMRNGVGYRCTHTGSMYVCVCVSLTELLTASFNSYQILCFGEHGVFIED